MHKTTKNRWRSDQWFMAVFSCMFASYIILILLMIWADFTFMSPSDLINAIKSEEIRYAIKLSLLSCTCAMLLSLLVGIPAGYIMGRKHFRGKMIVDALLDIPVILPPLVIGLSLLILFQTGLGKWIEQYIAFTYAIPGIILAQFCVSCAFAIRTLTVSFAGISPRTEQVAMTLGCSKAQAFLKVVLPEAKEGILTAASLAWARALGEFGPILLFAGATRMKTEVLPTTVFLEMSVGNIEAAVAVSLIMIVSGFAVLLLVRQAGNAKL